MDCSDNPGLLDEKDSEDEEDRQRIDGFSIDRTHGRCLDALLSNLQHLKVGTCRETSQSVANLDRHEHFGNTYIQICAAI